MVVAATNARAVTRTPDRCTHRIAPRLCAIHVHHRITNRYRERMGLSPLAYHFIAERYPARRGRLLTYWTRTQIRAQHRWKHSTRRAVSASSSVVAFLLCIHPFEEPAWNTVAGGLGYVSPPSSYPVTPTMHAEMDALVANYGDSWPNWPESAQLAFGVALYHAYGSAPWSTASHCT